MENELQEADRLIERSVMLKEYRGPDRLILAADKQKEIIEQQLATPPFRAMTGIYSLDSCTEGFRKGQVVIVSGPPKNGKTELCATFTQNMVLAGHKPIWLPFEGMYEELFNRFGDHLPDFFIPNQMRGGKIDWVENKIIEGKEKYDADVVFIDNLDFLTDPDVSRKAQVNYATYVGGLVQRIKELAVTHNVVIFLMAHIRNEKWTSNELPTSDLLRDSGKITQLADIVLMIIRWRAPKTGSEVYDGNHAMVGIMENRLNGKTKKIHMALVNKLFIEIDYARTNEYNSVGSESNWL